MMPLKGRHGCFSLINDVSVGKRIAKHLSYCLKAISSSDATRRCEGYEIM